MKKRPFRRSGLFLVLAALLLSFQNCQNFETNNPPASSSSLGSSSGSGTGGAPVAPPLPPANTAEEQAARLRECASLIIRPTISLSASEVTVQSGLATGAGDQNSAAVAVTSNKGLSNPARAQSLTCPINTTLRLQIVEGNGSALNTITTAKDMTGTERATAGLDAAAIRTLLNNAVQVQNNNQIFETASNSQSFVIRPTRDNNNANVLRCVQGEAWFRVTVRTEIGGTVARSMDSDPAFVRVAVRNNCWDESQLNPMTALSPLIQFGTAAAMNQNYLAVIAPKEAALSGALEVGSLYVFQRSGSTWNFQQKIYLPGAAARDSISAVEFLSDRMIVATKYRDNRGAFFVYGLSGGQWAHQSTFNPQSPQTNQEFGHALASNGNFLFVSAPQLGDSGAVFVYELVNGILTVGQMLTPAEGAMNTAFGFSLSSEGDTLVIGAPQTLLAQAEAAGQLHIYRNTASNWTPTQTLTPPQTVRRDGMRFGFSVAYRGGSLAVGAPHFATGGDDTNRGAVFYYGTLGAAPTDLRGASGEQLFGHAVHLMADRSVLVGAPSINNRAGQVIVYLPADIAARRISRRLYPLASAAQDNFGSFILSSGNSIAIGARAKATPNTGTGAAYVLVRR